MGRFITALRDRVQLRSRLRRVKVLYFPSPPPPENAVDPTRLIPLPLPTFWDAFSLRGDERFRKAAIDAADGRLRFNYRVAGCANHDARCVCRRSRLAASRCT